MTWETASRMTRTTRKYLTFLHLNGSKTQFLVKQPDLITVCLFCRKLAEQAALREEASRPIWTGRFLLCGYLEIYTSAAISRNDCSAATSVSSISASEWAVVRNQASYFEGAR